MTKLIGMENSSVRQAASGSYYQTCGTRAWCISAVSSGIPTHAVGWCHMPECTCSGCAGHVQGSYASACHAWAPTEQEECDHAGGELQDRLSACRSRERRDRERARDAGGDRDKLRSSEKDRHQGRDKKRERERGRDRDRVKDRKRHSRSRSPERSRKRAAPDSDSKADGGSRDKQSDKAAAKADRDSAKLETPRADRAHHSDGNTSIAVTPAAEAGPDAPAATPQLNGVTRAAGGSTPARDEQAVPGQGDNAKAASAEKSAAPEPPLANGHAESEHKSVSKAEASPDREARSVSPSSSPARSEPPAEKRKDSLSRSPSPGRRRRVSRSRSPVSSRSPVRGRRGVRSR